MEFGRFKQVDDLKEKGWTVLDELDLEPPNTLTCGGPTLMKNPEGLIHTVSCGKETLHNGGLYDTNGKTVVVTNGRIIALQG